MSEINEYLERFKKEIELDRKSPIPDIYRNNEHYIKVKNRVLSDLEEFVTKYIDKYQGYEELHLFNNKLKKYLKNGLITPLTLDVDEFKYISFGLCENIRYPSIKKNVSCIYDINAYELYVQAYFDSSTGREIETLSGTELNLDYNRCYLIEGGRITNKYFNIAKIKKRFIENHCYMPTGTKIDIPCIAICYEDKFILCTKTTSFGFSKLCKNYDIDILKDNNEELIKFNINNLDYEFS